jgi:hypothetical protein
VTRFTHSEKLTCWYKKCHKKACANAANPHLHDVRVSWVEAQRGGWGSVSDQVYPQQLHRDEALRQAQDGRQEDGRDLQQTAFECCYLLCLHCRHVLCVSKR